MRRTITNLMLVMLVWVNAYNLYGQCDQSGYTDLAGPCATSVCSYDAFCCATAWDGVCASEAASDPACVYCWVDCHDNDLDGFTNCSGDCDDFDAAIHPSAFDICGNGIDEDCSGSDHTGGCDVAGYTDLASPCGVAVCSYDGFCCASSWDNICASEAATDFNCQFCWCGCYDYDLDGFTNCDGDCNDFDNTFYPGAPEICDNIDNNCNGLVDDGLTIPYYIDNDGDGYGSPLWMVESCLPIVGYVTNADDCDDTDAGINPLAIDLCSNSVDDNCDGLIDNSAGTCDSEGYADLAGPCGTSVCSYDDFCCLTEWDDICAGEAASDPNCSYCLCGCYDNDMDGYTNCDGDCNDFDDTVYPGAEDICFNGIDEDCNFVVDDTPGSCDAAGYADLAGDCAISVCSYDDWCCTVSWDGICAGEAASDENCTYCICGCYDNDLDGYTNCDNDCDDFDASINPGASETCDLIDNDCDGIFDDGLPTSVYYSDADGDGYGDPLNGWNLCGLFPGYSVNNLDCNDSNPNVNPSETEVCNLLDDDCDLLTDEGVQFTYYFDNDGDGYGDPSASTMACSEPVGYVSDNTDCDDDDSAVNPGAIEICNLIDDDCDGDTDESVQNVYYQDADGDGYGDLTVSTMACSAPTGYVSDSTDCDDTDENINPGETEICANSIDDDCNGTIDVSPLACDQSGYADLAGPCAASVCSYDGFCCAVSWDNVCAGEAAMDSECQYCWCGCYDYDLDGFTNCEGDCDEFNSNTYPGAPEICDSQDNNCDGDIDEGLTFSEYYMDADGDGYGDPAVTIMACQLPFPYSANNLDCDDTNSDVRPLAPEVCNGIDDDCDGSIDEGVSNIYYADNDGDGYGDPLNTISDCSQPSGYLSDNTDCDDTDANINPAGTETCNDADDNCDGDIDEGVQNTYYQDSDGDGYGDAGSSVMACSAPTDYVTDDTDCDDSSASVYPGATETCDLQDEDCDGSVDEGVESTFYADADGDGYGDASVTTTGCTAPSGYVSDDTDCDDTDENVNPGATEVCGNGVDDDCDGNIDNAAANTYYADADGDGFGDASTTTTACTAPSGYVSDDTDCDDADASINPGADEVCNNGADDNCDGNTDELPLITFYADADGDGYGDASNSVDDCTAPSGYVTDDSDCDDNDENVNPGATEVCGNGVDDDCDGNTDNVAANTYYADADGDGYGDASTSTTACTAPSGYVSDDTDCDDADASINPAADEVCNNGADDNCDGNTDELPLFTFYADADGDGYGDASNSVDDCTAPSGYVTDDSDCDDTDENVNPGATELCGNGVDDDCDGNTDNVAANTYYADADGDGYGDASTSTTACTAPSGYVSDDTDCDDADASINPAADEVCNNGADDNCDGNTDELPLFTFYADADGDGYGDASNSVDDCTQPSGYVTDDSDCDDTDASVNPDASEVCDNGTDDDCDGNVDNVAANTYYADADGDGYGDASTSTTACAAPSGYVSDDTDCDDTDASVNPSATEVCDNGTDDDCDGNVDNVATSTYYADADGDGYGDASTSTTACALHLDM
ncbi:MAG: hypothetical protein IPP69_11925 [Flavobacteriales bacterium]|nr:hypothetical protein [Flavobacteriales bacterium]